MEETERDFEARRVLGAVKEALLGGDAGLSKIDRYEIRERIGQGAMGSVYRARDPELGRDVAIKLVHPASLTAADPSRHAGRLLREARTIARFSHPNVVAIYDAGRTEDDVFIAMELVEGPSLSERLKGGPLPWREAVALILGAARGLAAAHADGIVHRDVKPSNIVIAPAGVAKVVDFGLAVPELGITDMASDPTLASGDASPRITQTGAIAGTPIYMPPEQFKGRDVDARSDQYALCVSLYEALSGSVPFRRGSAAELYAAKVEAPLDPIEGLPAWLWETIVRGLKPDPDARFASVDELVQALQGPQPRRRTWPLYAAGAVVIAGAAWAASGGEGPCSSVAAELEPVWNTERRGNLRDGIVASGLTDAEQIARYVERRVDSHADAWVRERTRECRQSSASRSTASPCLRRVRGELDALLTVLAELAGEDVRSAPSTFTRLAPPHACATELGNAGPPSASRVELEDGLARVQALIAAGRYRDGIAAARTHRDLATEAGSDGIADTATYWIGLAHVQLGEVAEGTAEFEAVYESATARGDFPTAALAAVEILHETLTHGGERREVKEWARHAEVAVARVGDLPRAQARLESALAKLAWSEGRLTDARDRLEACLEHWRSLSAVESVEYSHVLGGLGLVLGDLGELEAARDAQLESLRVMETIRPGSPELALPLQNLSLATIALGDVDEASALAQRAFDLSSAGLGLEHPLTLTVVGNYAEALKRGERCEEAISLLAAALGDLPEGVRGHASVGAAHQIHGTCLLDLGRPAEAIQALERADDIFLASLEPPARLAYNRLFLATALWDSGRDPARAVALVEDARDSLVGLEGAEYWYDYAERWLGERQPLRERKI